MMFKAKLDTYTLQARLYPALLVVLPVGLTIVAWFPDKFLGWGFLVATLTVSGLTVLLSQLGRDLGKKKEPRLFELWGGKPTTRMLRHRDATLDKATRLRYHSKLTALLPEVKIPTPRRERDNPTAADAAYDSCIFYLREKTRDQEKFRLVFAENINYGFRRNLWAMKPIGIIISLLAIIALSDVPIVHYYHDGIVPLPIAVMAMGLNLLFLTCWIICIKPNWVKLAADAYAERLLAACDLLPIPEQNLTKTSTP